MSSSDSGSRSSTPDLSSKKRKRPTIAAEDELEIDVNLPEPPSKKALRRAKKGKPALPSTNTASNGTTTAGAQIHPDRAALAGTNTGALETSDPSKRSPHGIWIGNLPWSADRASLRDFFLTHAAITEAEITRVHMPAPNPASVDKRLANKPLNRGFAYVDFSGREVVERALKVSETLMTGRKVLIKDAKSFEGRPEKKAAGAEGEGAVVGGKAGAAAASVAAGGKPPSKRVFVGNLAFDTTKEDLEQHFGQAGAVEDVHMATFEDSGKCKGFAWIRFEELDAAESAVKGFIFKQEEEQDESEESADEDDVKEEVKVTTDADASDSDSSNESSSKKAPASKPKKAPKKANRRKWFINRLQGRPLRCEFAEDASTRYKKRYGKGSANRTENGTAAADASGEGIVEENGDAEAGGARRQRGKGDKDARQAQRRQKHVDARNIRPGAALANAPRASGAIVEGTGKKISFD